VSYQPRTDVVYPTLEIWIDNAACPPTLRCAGALRSDTGQAVLKAVSEMLALGPQELVFDISDLEVTDASGVNVLIQVRRMAQEAGVALDLR
jgi:anti-anti-sigma regulatory factor